ncbi:MAG: calcium/sodium antiporter [Rikenellaceae bacterium]
MNIFLILAGLLLILGGANYMTDGSAALAKRLKVSEFIIGLTIVAVGTSMPELVVSTISAFKGSGAMAIGNVVGSNIFNTYVILGMCALFAPVALTDRNMKRDIPMGILVSIILLLVCLGGTIVRSYGVLMFLIYIALILYSINSSKRDVAEVTEADEQIKDMPIWFTLLLIVGGLGALVFGGNIFLKGAINVAHQFGISDKVIAVTLLAGGTSLPEFAASVVSLVKGKSDIALGNVIGSNIANILLVLGLTSTITPLALGSITLYDILVVVAGSIVLYLAGISMGKQQITKVEGSIMLLIYISYMWWTLSNAGA